MTSFLKKVTGMSDQIAHKADAVINQLKNMKLDLSWLNKMPVEDMMEVGDHLRNKVKQDHTLSKQISQLHDLARMLEVTSQLKVESAFIQLPASEKDIAPKMKSKGYHFVIQFVNEDGTDFGEPLYFKTVSSVGPFMRDTNLKQKWVVNLNKVDA